MATIDDYTSGKVVKDVKLTLFSLKLVKIPIFGFLVKKGLLKRIKNFEPKTLKHEVFGAPKIQEFLSVIDINIASTLIHESEKCAVGERVCRAINKDSKFTESVFLDELAEGMTKAGKAQYVEKEKAINTLKKYPKNPLILAKVSNKYMEICRSYPQNCVFYNMEKRKINCLNRF